MDIVAIQQSLAQGAKRFQRLGLSAFHGLVPIGDRSSVCALGWQDASGSDYQQQAYRSYHRVLRSGRNIRLVYAGWMWDGVSRTELTFLNAQTISVGFELSNGTVLPVFFGGSLTGTINPGATLVSDPIPVALVKGDYFFLRDQRTVTNGQRVYFNGIISNIYAAGEGRDHGLTISNKTLSGTLPTTAGPVFGALPHVVLAEPTTVEPVVGIAGDSIAAGLQDDTGYGRDGGFLRRAFTTAQLGYIRLASPSDTVNSFIVAQNSARRRTWLAGCTSIIDENGINDVTGARTLAQLQADKITSWAYLGSLGAAIYGTTLFPQTTSTDGFTTLGAQTVSAYESVRVGFNQWLRDGAPMQSGAAVAVGTTGGSVARCAVYGTTGTLVTAASGPAHLLRAVFNTGATGESATDSGKWKVTGRTVADAAITTGTATLTSATANFTSADLGVRVNVVGAGVSGVTLNGVITAIGSTTSVTLDTNASTTVSAATAGIGAATPDGTHPTGAIHALAAGALAVAAMV